MNLQINTGVHQAFLVIGGFLLMLGSLLFAAAAGWHSLNSVNERLTVMMVEQQAKNRLLLKLQMQVREQFNQAETLLALEDPLALEEAWNALVWNAGDLQRMQEQLSTFARSTDSDAIEQSDLEHLHCELWQILQLAREGQQEVANQLLHGVRHEREILFEHLVGLRGSPQAFMQQPIFLEVKTAFDEIRLQVIWLGVLATLLCIAIITLIVYRIVHRETELSQALLALREVNERLETRVAERTAHLLEARNQAMEASRVKSQFLANMSHELRTPLNAVLGYSSLLSEHFTEEACLETEDVVSSLGKIYMAGQNLLELVEDILDISRLEIGQINIAPSEFDLHELLNQVLKTIQPLLVKRQNQLKLQYQTDLRLLRTDPVRLRQVLMHLLNNANKFTYMGDVTMCVQSKLLYEQEWIIVHIKDTGIGISPADQEKLFQVFSQVDASSTRQYGGVGLGLVICQRFCQLLGGSIGVQSEAGKGSTFTVRLPCSITGASVQPTPL